MVSSSIFGRASTPGDRDVGTPARVVPLLFLCQPRGWMLETTDMPHAHAIVRVLIVDDQASFRRAARSVVELTPSFVVVGEAESGEAAVEAAQGQPPDLVL